MSNPDETSKELLLEKSWDIICVPKTFEIHPGDVSHTPEFLTDAMTALETADKEEWLQIAGELYDEGNTHDSSGLAEEASAIYLNKKFNTSGLTVSTTDDNLSDISNQPA